MGCTSQHSTLPYSLLSCKYETIDHRCVVYLLAFVADIDLNNSEAVWKKLTEEERREFQELIKNGEIDDLIPPWIPWWEQEVPKIEEVTCPTSSTPAYVLNCPGVVDAPMLKEVMVQYKNCFILLSRSCPLTLKVLEITAIQ